MIFPEYFCEQNLVFRDNRDNVSHDGDQKVEDCEKYDRPNRFGQN
jgi:hypothetical protein